MADEPVTSNPDDEALVRSEVAELLANLDQGRCNSLLTAFNHAAIAIEATNVEAMWAVAMLQAQVLARAEIGGEQVWAATRMGELLRIALPGAIMQASPRRHPDA